MRKFLRILLMGIILLAVSKDSVYASSSVQNGVEVNVTEEKGTYKEGDKVKFTYELKNTNSYDVTGINLQINSPDSIEFAKGDLQKDIGTLKAGDSIKYDITAMIKNVSASKKTDTETKTPDKSKEIKSKDNLSAKNNVATNEKKINTNDDYNIVCYIMLLFFGLCLLAYAIKKKKINKIISLVLVVAIVSNMSLLSVYADDLEKCSFSTTHKIKIDNKEINIDFITNYDRAEDMVKLTVNTDTFGYDTVNNYYLTSSKLDGLSGTLENSNKYNNINVKVYNDKDKLVFEGNTPSADNWKITNIGLFPGKNEIIVTATDDEKELSTTVYLYDSIGLNYDKTIGANTDSDNDGIYDVIEEYIGTDINKADTDGDGLTDYQEVVELGTDPLKVDTDDNGISDYNEDADNDGISNGKEYEIGTDPTNNDSDSDGLLDNEELTGYNTSPTNKDTDGDGADDLWEISNGYNPLVYNESFTISYERYPEVTKENPVVPSVKLDLVDGNIDSLNIDPVSSYDNPYINPSVAGYLGEAYNFSVDGKFNSAEMTFKYDESLGQLSDTFQPRIYYFNESTKMFEELENQTVQEGKITATVTHFSTYILLNKYMVDTVWDSDIKKPDENGQNSGLSIAFVIDRSASMDDNDPGDIRKQLTKDFVNKMDFNKDQGSVISFIACEEIKTELTNDKQELIDAVDSIYNDSGWGWDSGTNGSAGIHAAIDQLKADASGNQRYIIFMTDGEDTTVSYSYDDLIATAKDNGIKILSIGLGSANVTLLKKLADETEGKYYFAEKAEDLSNIYENISNETIDYTTDSNNDGICDYYTNLIKDGTLTLSNGSTELSGLDIDYNENDDWDGDGLKNGEEIEVQTTGKYVYVVMKSNPFLTHSDGDGIDDYTEVKNGTDPLQNDVAISANNVDSLTNNDYYYYENSANNFQNDLLSKSTMVISAAIFGVWNTNEIYRDLIIDYYKNYDTEETFEQEEMKQKKKSAVEILNSLLESVKKYSLDEYNFPKDILTVKEVINGATSNDAVEKAVAEDFSKLFTKIHNASEEATYMRMTTNGMSYTKKLKDVSEIKDKVGKGMKIVDKISDGITYAGYGMDILDTIDSLSTINTNNEIFEANLDALTYLINNSKDNHAKKAALSIRNVLAGEYYKNISDIGADVLEAVLDIGLKVLTEHFVYVKAVVAVRDIFDTLFSISTDTKQMYEIICYHELSNAYIDLFEMQISDSNNNNYIIKYDYLGYIRYLTNLSQIRVLGETKFYEWEKYDGWTSGVMNAIINLDKIKSNINSQLSGIAEIISLLSLRTSSNVKFVIK